MQIANDMFWDIKEEIKPFGILILIIQSGVFSPQKMIPY